MYQIPSSLPPLFSGDRLVVYGVLKASENANEGDDNEVRLEGMLGNDEKVKHVVKFSTPPSAVGHKGNVPLHKLAAKSFIQEKQDGYSERNNVQKIEEVKRSTISISKSASVVSKFTSFVAVDKDSNQPVSGPLRKHFVPFYQSAAFNSPMAYGAMPVDACLGASLKTSGARKKGGFGFSSSNSRPKSSATKKNPKGFFSSLFGSAAPPRAPVGEVGCLAPREVSARRVKSRVGGGFKKSLGPRLDFGMMSQETKEAPAALSVISLQKAPGSWDLTDQLVSLCGTSRDPLIKGCPKEIAVDTGEGKLLWATALALVLLMGKFLNQKDEWEMIAEKGTKWMKKNLPAGVKYEIVLEAAATAVSVKIY